MESEKSSVEARALMYQKETEELQQVIRGLGLGFGQGLELHRVKRGPCIIHVNLHRLNIFVGEGVSVSYH